MERKILLQVKDLNVQIGEQEILSSINLTANKGRILGIIGESGSGKSMLCQAIMQSIPAEAKSTGQILYQDIDLTSVTKERLRDYRGRHMSMITQNPLAAFDSIQTIEMHFRETLKAHYVLHKKEIRQIAISSMNKVNLPNPEKLLQYYPFQLSGGMLQRVMIALSFAMQPKLYIADEPTTALDTVNQKKILSLFNQIRNDTDAAIIIVTHDLGVIAELADEVAVMYKGELIEQANVFDFFDAPQHWYTKKLLQSRIDF
ncbi:nickel import ATP-binding protein NikD [Lysinibacillus sp. KCTC 33748]|uniref:ABC transporter ATP-binding protein n=1 Tax=unclassified Lysinibacillus TaxID=2636778 RepID=UPI0009A681F1|nr:MULTISPECIES: ABC transporter ATP-binding protein [unclassified Lysinibacillus]OXS76262.1 nickel import ATP-binding protein NikD [Lysinibacillus sp. KCTC 33748]SKB43172.1 nickel transport system ATP-binding protein [Lysinibacillus sp. AC-3]